MSGPILRLAGGLVAAIPQLIALALVVVLTVAALRICARFFALVGAGSISLGSFEPEWAVPTARLVRLGVIVLAVIMAYPYVPGSSSEAFKAISIFAGILFSLGSGSWVANLIAGYSMIYRRAFRVGDRVEIAGITGTVEEAGCRIRHQDPDERAGDAAQRARPFEPRRQPHAAGADPRPDPPHGGKHRLRRSVAAGGSAAARSGAPHPGIADAPAPFVRQRELGEFAPEYAVYVATNDETAMEGIYAALHANIQDVFAEQGIQIMTPSYEGDPELPKNSPGVRRHVTETSVGQADRLGRGLGPPPPAEGRESGQGGSQEHQGRRDR